ncbi:hypothetical protein [Variovorax sp. HJSM1_2]|uniref:hypothetical protein n=1 Tax=Variovorax sp. HJSM1_2 TaxID=3366263 RepID=UPI003BECA997
MTISRNGDFVLVNEPSYRLVAADHQKTLRFAAACVVQVPRGLPLFFSVLLEQASSGAITVQGDNGLTVGGAVSTAELGAVLKLAHASSGVWDGQARVAGAGASIVTQAPRTGNFTLTAADSGTIIPVLGIVIATANAASDITAPVEIRRYDAALLDVVGSGVPLINPATGAAWGTLQVSNKMASIIIMPGSVADEYAAVKVGA